MTEGVLPDVAYKGETHFEQSERKELMLRSSLHGKEGFGPTGWVVLSGQPANIRQTAKFDRSDELSKAQMD